MSGLDEKHAASRESNASPSVLTITRPSPARQTSNSGVDVLSTIEDNESTRSLTSTHTLQEKLSTDRETSPFSPFYNPSHTRYSLEAHRSESKQNINVINSNAYDTDLEACLTPQKTSGSGRAALMKNKSRPNAECSVWPGQQQLKKKKKMMRKERGKHNLCGCMAGMPKRTQIWIKVVIALVVVGAAIGIGIGVSKAVGGGIWKNGSNPNAPIQGGS